MRLLAASGAATLFLTAVLFGAARLFDPGPMSLRTGEPPTAPSIELPRAASADLPIRIAEHGSYQQPPPAVRTMRGRFLAAFETYHFQEDGEAPWYTLNGNVGAIQELHEELVLAPNEAYARCLIASAPCLPPPHHLCLALELTGHVEVLSGATYGHLVVHELNSMQVLEHGEDACLRL